MREISSPFADASYVEAAHAERDAGVGAYQ